LKIAKNTFPIRILPNVSLSNNQNNVNPASTTKTWNVDNTKIKKLQVIFKTIERCNLACTYCYYFFGGDDSYKDRPATVSMNLVSKAVAFVRQAAVDLELDHVEIVFHGGEPMLQKVERFDAMCAEFRSAFTNISTQLTLAIQTNATLVTENWIKQFEKHKVYVGVSIDGGREENDKYRVDHKGRGSYEALSRGIQLLQIAVKAGRIHPIGAITVLNPEYEYSKIYRHLTEELEFVRTSYLLPDASHDSMDSLKAPAGRFGEILCQIFDEWVAHPGTEVRNIDDLLKFFQATKLVISDKSPRDAHLDVVGNQIIVIQSDGTLSPDDSLIPAQSWRNSAPAANILDVTLREYLRQPFFDELYAASRSIPDECRLCEWQRLCRGGDLENRFSSSRGFNNPSIFCEGLKTFYEHAARFLVENGFPVSLIKNTLSQKTFLKGDSLPNDFCQEAHT
jgi:uncharacterized protein